MMDSEQLFVADRRALDDASELIELFGQAAPVEAAARASRSRYVGNVIHFCHWRQIERLVELLGQEEASGTVH